MVVVDGFEMPGPLVFCVSRVIQAHRKGPLVTLVGVGDQVGHDKVANRSPESFGGPGTDAQRVRPMRGIGGLNNEAIQTGDGFMPCFGDHQRVGKAQHMLPLGLAQMQVQTIQKGPQYRRMLYNELAQGDILSGGRCRLALLASTDILLCSIWAIHKIRQGPINNIVEQDHRAIKRVTRPMLGFKAFDAAQSTLTGIELMHMLRKGQLEGGMEAGLSAAEQFYALAA